MHHEGGALPLHARQPYSYDAVSRTLTLSAEREQRVAACGTAATNCHEHSHRHSATSVVIHKTINPGRIPAKIAINVTSPLRSPLQAQGGHGRRGQPHRTRVALQRPSHDRYCHGAFHALFHRAHVPEPAPPQPQPPRVRWGQCTCLRAASLCTRERSGAFVIPVPCAECRVPYRCLLECRS